MRRLDTPDLCARLDRIKTLCDRLEDAQDDQKRYRELVDRIRVEAEAFQETICSWELGERPRAARA